MKAIPRFSVQALLLGVTFAALCLVSWNGYFEWYRQKHGDEIINSQLRASRNGDSIDDVSLRLGVEGVDIDADTTLGREVPRIFRQMCADRESGLLDSDQLLSFSVGRYGITLQFRDGRLINHDPAEYSNTGLPVSVGKLRNTPIGYQISQLVWQMGIPQAVAGVVSLITLVLAVVTAKRRQYSARYLKSIVAVPTVLCSAVICVAAKVEPISLACAIAGFTGAVAWNLAGCLTEAKSRSTAEEPIS